MWLRVLLALLAVLRGREINHPQSDNSTFGNIDEMRTNHLFLNLRVNGDGEYFEGAAIHFMTCIKDSEYVVMDY